MPQFVAQADTSMVSDMAAGILRCAEFTKDEEIKNVRGWSKQAREWAENKAKRFVERVPPEVLKAALDAYEETLGHYGYSSEESLGHDIWYTFNRHGVGFWSRDDARINALDVWCMRGEANVWRGRGGWLNIA